MSRLVLNTLGVMVEYYPEYQKRFNEPEKGVYCTAPADIIKDTKRAFKL